MKWIELLGYLKKLEQKKDERLEDTAIVYSSVEGEYFPCDMVEFNEPDDEFLNNNQLFIMTFDWGELQND